MSLRSVARMKRRGVESCCGQITYPKVHSASLAWRNRGTTILSLVGRPFDVSLVSGIVPARDDISTVAVSAGGVVLPEETVLKELNAIRLLWNDDICTHLYATCHVMVPSESSAKLGVFMLGLVLRLVAYRISVGQRACLVSRRRQVLIVRPEHKCRRTSLPKSPIALVMHSTMTRLANRFASALVLHVRWNHDTLGLHA